jgi:hypothetical protein
LTERIIAIGDVHGCSAALEVRDRQGLASGPGGGDAIVGVVVHFWSKPADLNLFSQRLSLGCPDLLKPAKTWANP